MEYERQEETVLNLANFQQESLGTGDTALEADYDTEEMWWVVTFESGKKDYYTESDLESLEEQSKLFPEE